MLLVTWSSVYIRSIEPDGFKNNWFADFDQFAPIYSSSRAYLVQQLDQTDDSSSFQFNRFD
jgi:hypothetical protein